MLSFRLGGSDGVSIEAAKWADALVALGHQVVRVAGEGEVETRIRGLAIGADTPPGRAELESALEGADLVIVENLASLPLNPGARDVLYEVLEGRRALFHHHDLAWQREHLAHLEGPRDAPDWHHVTINDRSRRELLSRGIEAVTIMNHFDCSPELGNRTTTRARLGVGDERLALLATRAIARKNVAGALELCAALGATLWLLGEAEDGYGPELEALVSASGVRVHRGLDAELSIADAYAAADLVVMSSTWEGFGNPVLESVTHRRPLALYPYPVAVEIVAHGFTFFALDDIEGIAHFLDAPDEALYEANLVVARSDFNLTDLAPKLAHLLASIGIMSIAS